MNKKITKKKILAILKQNRERLYKKYNVISMALFGSFARDEANNNSDIDILVDIEPSFENLYNLKGELEDIFETKVDLVTKNALRSFIKQEIDKDIIYV